MNSASVNYDEIKDNTDGIVDPCTSISSQIQPIKGILKHAAPQISPNREKLDNHNVICPIREHRPSPDRFPERPTRIPKLSLTWSEKNAVYGDTTSDENTTENDDLNLPTVVLSSSRIPYSSEYTDSISQTPIIQDDESELDIQEVDGLDDDENQSEMDEESIAESSDKYSESCGNSHIAGRWWFGKSTKFIPHCAKRGCNHIHSDTSSEYLTPTQRRTKEIHNLKKQLKTAIMQLQEKESHLTEMRVRLHELESILESSNSLNECGRHFLLHKDLIKNLEEEKRSLIEKHEIRVKQLIQETLDARNEISKYKMVLGEKKPNLANKETMTEITEMAPDVPCPTHPEPPQCRMCSSFPSSPQSERPSMVPFPQEYFLQLQAYQNEAVVWRTKAAQLEIVLKEQIMKSQQNNVELELQNYKDECERLRLFIQQSEATSMNDSGIEANNLGLSPERRKLNSSNECYSTICVESKNILINENNQLHEKVEEQFQRLNECEEDLLILKNTINVLEDENKKNSFLIKQISRENDEKNVEIQAANMTVVRLQNEITMKTKAICYLEERHQAYRNVILDNNLVISDEATSDWRRGFSDPKYTINISKRVQTNLTAEALRRHESEFMDLHEKLVELEQEFSSKNIDLREKFGEIEKNLIMKTSLVESLSHQLNEADKEAIRSSRQYQKEREVLHAKINELAQVAERVPILEFEIEKFQQERSLLELQLQKVKEEFENGLEAALNENLKKYKEQSSYWSDKMLSASSQNENLKAEVAKLMREMDDVKLKYKMEKTDMAHRLTSSIDHVSHLKNQINRQMKDVGIDVHPRVLSKYVSCRPNHKDKTTAIEKGDLFDEMEERLKLCQGELNTTRRQIEVLQQKFIDNVQFQTEKKLVRVNTTPIVNKLREVIEDEAEWKWNKGTEICNEQLKKRIDELERKNMELSTRLSDTDCEKQNIIKSQRNQISHLVAEFDTVRAELDQEIGKYEREQNRLKNRIEMLEKDKKKGDKLIERLRLECSSNSIQTDIVFSPLSVSPVYDVVVSSFPTEEHNLSLRKKESEKNIKRCLSVPEIIKKRVSDEMSVLRERNSVLARANAQLTHELESLKQKIEKSIRKTVSHVSDFASNNERSPSLRSDISPTFTELASDLNQVRADLENILIQIDGSINESDRGQKVPEDQNNLNEKDLDQLRSRLKHYQDENEALHEQLDRVTEAFRDACRELEVYKSEPLNEVVRNRQNISLSRSRSFTEIGRATVDLDEYQRWREKTGTMFRELNRIRKEYSLCDTERRELRMQLVILRGELGLAQCQLAELSTHPKRAIITFSPNLSFSKSVETNSNTGQKKRCVKSTDHSAVNYERKDSIDDFASFGQWSINDNISISEPEMSRGRRIHARKLIRLRRTPTKDNDNRREHAEIVKDAAKLQIASLKREIDRLKDKKETSSNDDSTVKGEKDEVLLINERLRVELQKAHSDLISLRSSVQQRISSSQSEEKRKISQLMLEIETIKEKHKKQVDEEVMRQSSYEVRLSFLTRENEMLLKKMDEMEIERQEMYLVMFKKGKESAEHDVQETKVIDNLTEDRIVLRFLHDAFYYYLLNKGDSKEHLQAIMAMLNFTRQQKEDVVRKRGTSH